LASHPLLITVLSVVLGTVATLIFIVPADKPKQPERAGPTTVPKNGAIEPVTGVRIVKRVASRSAYVLRDGVAHSIPNGGTFICNAEYYPIEFNVPPAVWNKRVKAEGDDARCPAGRQPELGPATLATGYLLIERDEARETDPRKGAWQVVDGQRVPAPKEGPMFDCLSRRYLAWDYVSTQEIRAFPRHPTLRRARCP
jgi:hypothetical protein